MSNLVGRLSILYRQNSEDFINFILIMGDLGTVLIQPGRELPVRDLHYMEGLVKVLAKNRWIEPL